MLNGMIAALCDHAIYLELLVGVAGFEPAASSSRSNLGGYALVWAKPNRGPLTLTCANALSGSC
jgi:hypothetical protein